MAVLYAIWLFLVALAPLLEAFGTFMIGVITALYEIAKITVLFTLLLGMIDIMFDPRGKQRMGQLVANLVGGALGFVTPLVTALAPTLNEIAIQVVAAWKTSGPALSATFGEQFQAVAEAALLAQREVIPAGATSTPANAIDTAALFFKVAFGFGLGSAAVTAAFEALTPEKLNTLNGAGPMLANLAGFKEVAEEVLGPLYKHGFGTSLDYQYRSQFRPELPNREEAEELFARAIITAEQRDGLVAYSGLNAAWADASQAGRFHPVSPRILARAMDFGAISHAEILNVLTFAGYRQADQEILLEVFDAAAIEPYQKQALSALMTAAERGTIPDAELVTDLQDLQIPDAAIHFVQLAVAYRRLEQLAELYRKSVSEGYKYGTVLDVDYVPTLEAIGIGAADAQAHYAVDSIAKNGRFIAAAERATLALGKKITGAATRALVTQFRAGEIDAPALLAELILAGNDPSIAGFIVTAQTARKSGTMIYTYGLLLPRDQAVLLKEKVAALKLQSHARLIDYAGTLDALAGLGIPDANARALAAEWEATKQGASTVGVLEQR